MWKPAERILITPTCHQMSRQREALHAGQILYMFNDLAQFSKDAVKILMAFDSKRGAFWTFSQQPYSHETALAHKIHWGCVPYKPFHCQHEQEQSFDDLAWEEHKLDDCLEHPANASQNGPCKKGYSGMTAGDPEWTDGREEIQLFMLLF